MILISSLSFSLSGPASQAWGPISPRCPIMKAFLQLYGPLKSVDFKLSSLTLDFNSSIPNGFLVNFDRNCAMYLEKNIFNGDLIYYYFLKRKILYLCILINLLIKAEWKQTFVQIEKPSPIFVGYGY